MEPLPGLPAPRGGHGGGGGGAGRRRRPRAAPWAPAPLAEAADPSWGGLAGAEPPSAPALRAERAERQRRAAEGQFNQCWRQRHHRLDDVQEESLPPPQLFDEAEHRFGMLEEPPSARARSAAGAAEATRPAALVSAVEGLPLARLWAAGGLPLDEMQACAREEQVQDYGLRKARFFDRCLRAGRDLSARQPPRRGGAPLPGGEPPQPPHTARASQGRASPCEDSLPLLEQAVGGSRSSSERQAAGRGSPPAAPREAAPAAGLGETMAGLVRSCSRAKILPVTTGIIRNAGTCLALEHGCMTDARAEAMSSTIRASSAGVREARLRSNGLSQQGAAYLLEALPEDVVSVDISQNSLGHDASALCRALSRLTNLRSLSMSDSQIHDSGCKALMGCLAACKQLVSLDLSGNSIYHGGAQIGSFVERHRTLESLDVHWNHISGDSGRDLARGIRENGSAAGALRNVNLSWNPLGKAGGEDTCRQLAQAFSLGKLEHVDLKNCDLSAALCRILADGMRENTSVLGIHIEGNGLLEMPGDGWVGARVDPWGFLLVPEPQAEAAGGPGEPPPAGRGASPAPPGASAAPEPPGAAGPPEPQGALPLGLGGSAAGPGSDAAGAAPPAEPWAAAARKSCCWVCDGWREVRLSYVPGISGPELPPGAPTAWVFTSADSFARGVRMTRFGEELVAYLMAPRGQLLYCFQVGGRLLTSATSRLAPELAVGMRPRRVRREPVGGEGAAGPLEVDVVRFNALQVSQRPAGERACRWLVPRRPGELRAGDGGRPAEWHVERSLFAHHEDPLRHQGFCERRFAVDWGLASCAELVGEDEDAVRDFLGRAYGEVQMLYSSFCSVDWENAQRRPSDRQWPLSFGVTLHEYAHLLVQGALLTGEFGLGEADAHFVIAAAAPVAASRRAPGAAGAPGGGRVVTRAGFLDLLVRLALLSAGRASGLSPLRALHNTFGKSLLAARKAAARAAQWRHDVLHSEVVEAVCRRHLSSVLRPLFLAFARAGAGAPPPEAPAAAAGVGAGAPRQPRLPLEGWLALLDAVGVLPYRDGGQDAQTNLWDRTWLWRASAMERFDETRSTDHLELWFVEFLEAMARLAALLRSRALAGGPDDAPEAGRAEDGLGPVPPAFAFGLDKDGVMDKDAFAGHLDAFLGSAAVRAAARPPSGGAAPA